MQWQVVCAIVLDMNISRVYMKVLGIFPPKQFPPPRFSVATLFRYVACFACVRIEDSSRNKSASTAYFAKPGTFGGEHFGHLYVCIIDIAKMGCFSHRCLSVVYSFLFNNEVEVKKTSTAA